MTDVQVREEIVPAPAVSDATNIMQVISRIAADPTIDIDRLERMMDMHERVLNREAKSAYAAALSAAQPKLPVIVQRGEISIDKGKTVQSRFAKWEDINEAIQPVLAEHGFALSFRTERAGDQVIVTCILSHAGGHSESTTLPLPLDVSGSKNNVQGVGSSISYGKRYTASALLNITSRGEDDDGKAAGDGGYVNEDQADAIQALMEDVGADRARFLKFIEVESIATIPAANFDKVMRALEAKRAK